MCAQFLTFKTKKNQPPKTFLYTPSWSWGQAYSSLNSAKLSLFFWGHAIPYTQLKVSRNAYFSGLLFNFQGWVIWIFIAIAPIADEMVLHCPRNISMKYIFLHMTFSYQMSFQFNKGAELYIPSTLNIDLILWHTQLIVSAVNGLNHGLFLSLFKVTPSPIHWIVYVLAYLNFIFEF